MNTEDPAVAATPEPAAVETRGQPPGDVPAPKAAAAAAHGTAGARRRRPEPARTAPHRHAAALLRASVPPAADAAGASEGAATATAPVAGAAHAEGPVALGVRLGYQVIEEQILLGQTLARRLGRKASQAVGGAGTAGAGGTAAASQPAPAAGAAPGIAGTAGEVNELVDRVLHLYKDLGALCFDAVEAVARNPLLRAGAARLAAGAAAAPAGAEAAASAPGGGFEVDIRCSRRTQVTLDLRLRPGHGMPLVHALHAGDPTAPPLTGVRFQPGTVGPVLQLTIADTQPAATYTGVVVDSASNEPRGTLVVRVLPPGA